MHPLHRLFYLYQLRGHPAKLVWAPGMSRFNAASLVWQFHNFHYGGVMFSYGTLP